MLPAKQIRDCRVGDFICFKNKESRMITNIDRRNGAYLIRTTTLAGENPHFDTYDASDEVNIWGSQGALF